MTAAERLTFDATSTSLIGVLFGALVLGALGVKTISGEYATGMIRTSAAAVPARTRILAAKVAVTATATFLVALVADVAGFLIGQNILDRQGISASITDRHSVAAIVGGAVAVSAFAAIGVGLGTIVRRAAVANILMAVVVIGGQLVGTAMPATSQRFLPFNALQATVSVVRSDELLAPTVALGSIVGYAVIAVAVAGYLLHRRDV